MYEAAYAEKTSNTSCTATSEAAADTVVSSPIIYCNGSDEYMIEFATNAWAQTSTSPTNRLVLFDNGTAIGTLFQGVSPSTSSGKRGFTVRRRITPSVGYHTFSIRGWVSSASTWTIAGDTFGSGIDAPAYIRVSRILRPSQAFYDVESRLDFTSSNSWTHSPGTPFPRGAVVVIVQDTSATDVISGVTYGGVAMTRVPTNGLAQDTAGEPGAAYAYFLGSGIPSGPKTVAVTVSSGTTAKRAHCFTVAAPDNTRVAASGRVQGDTANPSVTLSTTSAFAGLVVNALFSGQNDLGSLGVGAGYDPIGRDFGSQTCAVAYGHKTGSSVASGWTATSDDVAMVALAVEVVPSDVPSWINERRTPRRRTMQRS
jgi:hypothetical protein